MKNYIERKFGVDINTFLHALQMSPGAEGYIHGSLSELLFKEYAEKSGYEVYRIKEKPEGGYNAKSDDARGDFYIRKKGNTEDEWFVIENKGVKSNAEKRANLTNKKSCLTLLTKHSVKRDEQIKSIYKSGLKNYNKSKEKFEEKYPKLKFPDFNWSKENPGAGIPNLTNLWNTKNEIEEWLDTFNDELYSDIAFWDLKAPVRLIQTHMPSTRTDVLGIKSTGPLKSEFNILCLDLFIRTGKHEFVFANSQELNHQAKSPNHLQQNYTIDILTEKEGFKRHQLLFPWYDNLEECIKSTNPIPRKIDFSQLDKR